MSILNQKTIKKSFSFTGVGLHTGKITNLTVNPAKPNTGIVFKRTDLKTNNFIIPSIFNVSDTTLCTTVSNESGTKVATIEHLMGALYGKGIDNALIEVNSEEIPILDGSAKDFANKITSTGTDISDTPIRIIKINKKIHIKDGSKSIYIEPSNTSLKIDFEIKYKNKLISNQRNSINLFESDLEEIYESRTFCLYEDIEKLKQMNLGLGGSLDNAIVVKDNKVLNNGGLRNDKEFVNHKILDCMGDLYLSGYRIIGNIVCSQGGHKLTNQLLRKVFENNENFSIIEIKEKNIPNSVINKYSLKSIA